MQDRCHSPFPDSKWRPCQFPVCKLATRYRMRMMYRMFLIANLCLEDLTCGSFPFGKVPSFLVPHSSFLSTLVPLRWLGYASQSTAIIELILGSQHTKGLLEGNNFSFTNLVIFHLNKNKIRRKSRAERAPGRRSENRRLATKKSRYEYVTKTGNKPMEIHLDSGKAWKDSCSHLFQRPSS